MNSREILIAGLDILLAILVVFVLAFFAVRYDETRGPEPEIRSVSALELSETGDYDSMHYVGLYLDENEVWLREFRFGTWLEPGPKLSSDWEAVVDAELRRMGLPVVIYELERTQRFGAAVRLVSSVGQPVGIASAPNTFGGDDE